MPESANLGAPALLRLFEPKESALVPTPLDVYFSFLDFSPSEVRARHEDEEYTKRHGDSGENEECHCRTCSEEPSNERLSNP
jgi:hypothetical protein